MKKKESFGQKIKDIFGKLTEGFIVTPGLAGQSRVCPIPVKVPVRTPQNRG